MNHGHNDNFLDKYHLITDDYCIRVLASIEQDIDYAVTHSD